ncbi:hypothetical protein PsorP6_014976 [Peronosclerospora sorghi]|uniref:Uncharacterized protein n=1 Tax=Peronosclerospora sorghi TaxID=230839 RepID=A0ACC0VRZ4_9STRA|nr:hypothetical protein PsorP6_014976 [Peronosclerospora sorghi]
MMDDYERLVRVETVHWRAKGCEDDETYERRSELKAEMFPEDTFPDPKAAESTVDDTFSLPLVSGRFVGRHGQGTTTV